MKDVTYVVSLDENANLKNTYFDRFGVEHISMKFRNS